MGNKNGIEIKAQFIDRVFWTYCSSTHYSLLFKAISQQLLKKAIYTIVTIILHINDRSDML